MTAPPQPDADAREGMTFGRRVAIAPFVWGILAYRATLSPLMGRQCRFTPTCSEYALQSFRRHGVARGIWLTVRRIGRCHPWGGSGYDPPPIE